MSLTIPNQFDMQREINKPFVLILLICINTFSLCFSNSIGRHYQVQRHKTDLIVSNSLDSEIKLTEFKIDSIYFRAIEDVGLSESIKFEYDYSAIVNNYKKHYMFYADHEYEIDSVKKVITKKYLIESYHTYKVFLRNQSKLLFISWGGKSQNVHIGKDYLDRLKKHLQFIQLFKEGVNLIEVDSKQQRTVSRDSDKLEKVILKKENDIAKAYRKLLHKVNDPIKFSPLIRSIREVSYFYKYIYLEQSHLWSRSQNDRHGKKLFDEYYNACLQEHLDFISTIAQNIHSLHTATSIPESVDQDFYRLLFPADNLFQRQIRQIESKIDSIYILTFSELKKFKSSLPDPSPEDRFFDCLKASYFGYKSFHKSEYDLLEKLSHKHNDVDVDSFYMKNLKDELSYIRIVNSNINLYYLEKKKKISTDDNILDEEIWKA